MMKRALILIVLGLLLNWLSAADKPKPKPIRSPLSPPEEKKHIHVVPGLRLELVASEPQIESPVAMAFDEDGKLWVVEMRDYPNPPPPGKPGKGRIKVLEDRNGDGHYEHSQIFADELLFANGILPWNGGVIVTAAPHVLFLKDSDGDGRAEPAIVRKPVIKDGMLQLDQSTILYEGFAAKNPQLRVSHPKLGMDGWVYVANGLRGGKSKRAGIKGEAIDLSGRDFRFDLLHDRHEAISGMGQYGNTFDDWGRRFVADNRHHLRHIVFPNQYLKRNPLVALRQTVQDISVLDDGPLSSGGKIYPLSKNWTTSNLHAGRFTAACSVFIYRSGLLPKEMQGSALTCDPTGNLVHRENLTPKGATFEARPARKGVEFLASPEDWFRPVNLTYGPDGAIYLVDMYRAVIEHPQFMPTELKNRPDLLQGNNRGRIWRIVPEKHQTKAIRPKLSDANSAALVKAMAHPNAWVRETAHRLLLTRNDPKANKLLYDTCTSAEDPRARAYAAHLLAGRRKLDEPLLVRLLQDSHARVREQAIRLSDSLLSKSSKVQNSLFRLANDADSHVRFRTALALSNLDDDRILKPLATILKQTEADHWTRSAVACALSGRAGKLFALMASHANPEVLSELAELVGAGQKIEEVAIVLSTITRQLNGPRQGAVRLAAFHGLIAGMERRGARLATFLRKLSKDQVKMKTQMADLLKEARAVASRPGAGLKQRSEAIGLMAHEQWSEARKPLTELLQTSKSSTLRVAAVGAMAKHTDPEIGKLLMQGWSGYAPSMRRAVTDAMLRRTDRIQMLLAAIEKGMVKPGDIDAVRRRRLVGHRTPAIRAMAQKLLQSTLPKERKAVMAKYQAALKLKGNAINGKAVFKKNCSTCHQVGDIGTTVGPVISDTRTKTPAALLTAILNPNQAIDNNYINYIIETEQGRTLNGIILAETASSITLQQAEQKTEVILRKDIAEIRSTGVSLMPEGLEKEINLQQMADLISFLKNWRYLDGKVPVGKK